MGADNASCFYPTPLKNLSTDELDHNYIVNARSPLMLSQLFTQNLARNYNPDAPHTAGRIINFIDINILGQTLPNHIAYNASKAALHQITASLAIELAPKITVNAIAPGVITWADSYSPEQQKTYLKRVPLNRPGTPQDAASAVKYLVCDAHYTTGQVLKLDGGRAIT